MKRLIAFTALACASLSSAQALDWTKFRRVAQIAGCAASGLDAATTLRPGITETNPLLGRGKPNAAAIIGVKAALCGAQIAIAERRHSRYQAEFLGYAPADAKSRTASEIRAEKVGAFVGLGNAALFGAIAAHNLQIARPRP